MQAEPKPEITEDHALGGRLRLKQPRRGHRFGHDGVLLAAATEAGPGDHVVDFGAGVGIAGLAVAARVPDVRVTLIERDPFLAELAAENARQNNFADRVSVLCADVCALQDCLHSGPADSVIMNPPFNDPRRGRPSPDPLRAAAHDGGGAVISKWIEAAADLLRPGGALTLIWRSDRRRDLLAALSPAFGDIRLCPVAPKPATPAIRDLVRGRKGGTLSLIELPALLLNEDDGRPSSEAEAILRRSAPIRLAP
jgi:tRNA1(Val) A37 N6-methylase TrmN6